VHEKVKSSVLIQHVLLHEVAYCIEQRNEHFSPTVDNAIVMLDLDVGFIRDNKKLKGVRWQDPLIPSFQRF
jgi:hypothetical protein